MVDLTFCVLDATASTHTASPEIALRLEVRTMRADQTVESVLLRSVVRIEASARSHDEHQRAKLRELFGEGSLWGRGSHSLVWCQTTSVVSRFQGKTQIGLTLPCSYDLAAVASKYLRAVGQGEVPIVVQLSGTVFHATPQGLQAAPIPWHHEARFALSTAVFEQALAQHFPDASVITLRRELFDRLDAYRVAQGLGSWDHALDRLLSARGENGEP